MNLNDLLLSIARWLSGRKGLTGFDVSYRDDVHSYVAVTMYVGARAARLALSLTRLAFERWTDADVAIMLARTFDTIPPDRSYRDSNP